LRKEVRSSSWAQERENADHRKGAKTQRKRKDFLKVKEMKISKSAERF
jgi:hypothetical protein